MNKPLTAFDPHLVPVQRVDSGLPSPTSASLQPQGLRARFSSGHVWTPEVLAEARFLERPMARAAVLLALVQRASGLQVLLTERSAALNSHGGQIAFPGGKVDAQDVDAVATALRETKEEVGLDEQWIEVLGTLPIYTTGSAFQVTPVVALVQPGFVLAVNAHEVAAVFEVPLAFLMNPAHHRHHVHHWAGSDRHWLSMPYHDGVQERFIWGATAGMLRNFYRFLLD